MCDLTASSTALVLERCFSSEDGAGREAIIKGRSNVTWCKSIDILLQNILVWLHCRKCSLKLKTSNLWWQADRPVRLRGPSQLLEMQEA